MKNMMNMVAEGADRLAVWGDGKVRQARDRLYDVLTRKSGEGFVDTALVRHVSI